jgi:hypothetical protein
MVNTVTAAVAAAIAKFMPDGAAGQDGDENLHRAASVLVAISSAGYHIERESDKYAPEPHAILPRGLSGETLSSMFVGDRAYVVPWAMWVDEDRRCWLYANESADDRPRGTSCMEVAREADGYHVYLPPSDHDRPRTEWEPRPGHIPVAELHSPRRDQGRETEAGAAVSSPVNV